MIADIMLRHIVQFSLLSVVLVTTSARQIYSHVHVDNPQLTHFEDTILKPLCRTRDYKVNGRTGGEVPDFFGEYMVAKRDMYVRYYELLVEPVPNRTEYIQDYILDICSNKAPALWTSYKKLMEALSQCFERPEDSEDVLPAPFYSIRAMRSLLRFAEEFYEYLCDHDATNLHLLLSEGVLDDLESVKDETSACRDSTVAKFDRTPALLYVPEKEHIFDVCREIFRYHLCSRAALSRADPTTVKIVDGVFRVWRGLMDCHTLRDEMYYRYKESLRVEPSSRVEPEAPADLLEAEDTSEDSEYDEDEGTLTTAAPEE